jgi:hypothetical protein
MAAGNPIERRVDTLREQWTEFVCSTGAHMLRWVVEPEELRMVEAFLALEDDERTGKCPDLFIRLEPRFDGKDTYGSQLFEALEKYVDESRDTLASEGSPLQWRRAPPPVRGSGIAALLASAGALRKEFEDLCENLALVLIPTEVSDPRQWAGWLKDVVQHAIPSGVRLVVLDDAHYPALEELAVAEPERVWTIKAGLEMGRALEEVSREAGNLEMPGGQLRELLVRMGNAAARGHLEAVERMAAQAEKLAQGQGWNGLVVAVHFVVGGALLGARRPRDAAERYRQAMTAAAEAESRGEPEGAGLKLKSRVALAAALVAAESYGEAAREYEEAAGMAKRQGDELMKLEGWRMASWCLEKENKLDEAWAHGLRAWEAGREMDVEARTSSTVGYAAEALLRVADARGDRDGARQLEEEFKVVLGLDWRPEEK